MVGASPVVTTEATPPASAVPDIAVIGFSGRFPGARDANQYWANLRSGVESISFFSDEELVEAGVGADVLGDPKYVKAAPILDGVTEFDAAFFGYSPREARMIDPQQRLFLEIAWEALEHAGYDGTSFQGPIGLFAGAAMNTYLLFAGLLPEFTRDYVLTLVSNDKDFLATRASYKLNLRGPSVTVQTACSTSLVAVHIACQSLLNSECDIAMAGGVSVRIPHKAGYLYREGGIFSPDGHCRAFDAEARGTVFGSGVGCVVVKRLAEALTDGDTVHAVIKGSAVNNDGSSKMDFTAPSLAGQSRAVVEALAHAGVDPETISYIETHGTGTPLGDPVEIAALTKAFRAFTAKKRFCAIGSVKTNIGHMDAAAGVAGLIKTILALKNRSLPPSLHFRTPNPQINFEETPFYVNTLLSAWDGGPIPRRAAINSLGMGGTNAFLILEEAPPAHPTTASRSQAVVVLSAKTPTALEEATTRLAEHLRDTPDTSVADVAYTLQVGRRHWPYRRAAVCRNHDEACAVLAATDRLSTARTPAVTREVVFMFTGQGAQHVNMGRDLYRTEAVFRDDVDRSADILCPHLRLDLRDVLYPSDDRIRETARLLDETWIAQPALFAVEHALARLWQSWGVRPDAMIGHSLGEYVAACLAGVFSMSEALLLVAARGSLMQALPSGAMLAVPLTQRQIAPFLDQRISLAAINGPSLCTVAGDTATIEDLEKRLSRQGIASRRLRTSRAFHSAMMDPAVQQLAERVSQVSRSAPQIPFVSNVSGTWIAPDQATAPDYWARQARDPVRFADGLRELLGQPNRVFLEVGPGHTLATLMKLQTIGAGDNIVVSSLPGPDESTEDDAHILAALVRMWLAGVDIDWSGFQADERRHRVPLPTYPFERRPYWYTAAGPQAQRRSRHRPYGRPKSHGSAPTDPKRLATDPALQASDDTPRTLPEQSVAGIFEEVLGLTRVGRQDDFFLLGGNSLLMAQAVARLNDTFDIELSTLDFLGSPTVERLAQCVESVRLLERDMATSPETKPESPRPSVRLP
jgi:phthiocerol/phenolphthiocerol synthesis type-I polyketide synthase E